MKVGDLVVRKKYDRDIVFVICEIDGDTVFLKGKEIRLLADSNFEDLEVFDGRSSRNIFDFDEKVLLEREDFLKGSVLHIDGDERYLQMCLEKYEQLGISAAGYFIAENEMKNRVVDLLIKHKPDILVITGHDCVREKDGEIIDVNCHSHSRDFVETVKRARTYQPDRDTLFIFAGACQSHYESLIANGANFASSPERVNIHVFDPVYVVSQIANIHVTMYADLAKIVKYTSAKEKGVGGVDSKGVARRIYPGR